MRVRARTIVPSAAGAAFALAFATLGAPAAAGTSTTTLPAVAPAAVPGALATAPLPIVDLVTGEAVLDRLEDFQAIADANGGNRALETPGYEAGAEYVEQVLTDAGYTPERQYFTFERESIDANELAVPGLDPIVNGYPAAFAPDTPPEGVSGPLVEPVDALKEGCTADTWDGVEVTGAVALVSRGVCPFADKVLHASNAGAVAVVLYNNQAGVLNPTLGEANDAWVPTVGITQAQGAPIVAALAEADEPLVASLVIETSIRTFESFNVLAETPTGREDNVVMVGAHLDSVEDGPGINDNASGSAAILETAVQLAAAGEVNNKVRFAWWGAEEVGLIGSWHYVDDLVANDPDELDRIATYLNFDMVGSPNYVIGVYDADESTYEAPVPVPDGSIATEAVFTDYFDSIDQPWVDSEFSGRSDYQAFIANGIPASGLFTGADGSKTAEEVALFGGTPGIMYDPNYHTPADDITNVNLEALDIMSKAIAHATASLADDTYAVNGVATPGERPVVTFTSPAVGDTVRGELVVTGTATDDYALLDDTVTVHLRPINPATGNCGAFVATEVVDVTDGAWTATFPAGVVPDGKYCVTALTKDNAGQENAGGGSHLKWIVLTDGRPLLTDVTAEPRCVAGRVALAVRAVNGEDVKVDVRLATDFGERKVSGVTPGNVAYQSFATRAVSVPAGTATVSAYLWDGVGYHEIYDVDYDALSC